MEPLLSVIIPNRNGSATIGKCLEAALASDYRRFEVIVVDDCSEDDSAAIISAYPCRLIRLQSRQGAARARNVGALHSGGRVLFFIDADCLVQSDTLARIERAAFAAGPGAVIGGTYTAAPGDMDFFSRFQSIFIRYFENKRSADPDYIASHAMAMHAETFKKSNGFPEEFLPIIEDVCFSHRLRELGYRLMMDPEIEVTHIFNFSLQRSLRNAFRKSFYWTIYSLGNRDLFADSGTASRELKVNVLSWFAAAGVSVAGIVLSLPALPELVPAVVLANALVSRKFLHAFWKAGGSLFAVKAAAYYLLVYPLAVGAGAFGGMVNFVAERVRLKNKESPLPKEA